jgi:carbon monoxide dehydrogenase subunit G
MDFTNEFTVDAPLATVWEFMQNAEEVTPCVPGASITEQIDDTHYKGTVKVKLGAVQMSYRGEMEMVPDEGDRTITLQAKGRETRGSGGASGTVTTRLVDAGDGRTKVEIHSQIDVTGRVAQFGRGIMQDVANRLIKDFAACLEQKMTASTAAAGPDTETSTASAPSDPQSSAASTPSVTQSGSASAPSAAEPAAAPQPASPQGSGSPRSRVGPGSDGTSTSAAAALASSSDQSGGGAQSPSSGIATTGSQRSSEPPAAANELSISQLLVDVFRSRAAGWLRSAANRIEPK